MTDQSIDVVESPRPPALIRLYEMGALGTPRGAWILEVRRGDKVASRAFSETELRLFPGGWRTLVRLHLRDLAARRIHMPSVRIVGRSSLQVTMDEPD